MIPIIESVTTTFDTMNFSKIDEFVLSKDFRNFINDFSFDKKQLSIDIANGINALTLSAVANPIVADVYVNDKLSNDIFIKFNNHLFNISKGKIYDNVVYLDNVLQYEIIDSDDKREYDKIDFTDTLKTREFNGPSENYIKIRDFISSNINKADNKE